MYRRLARHVGVGWGGLIFLGFGFLCLVFCGKARGFVGSAVRFLLV